MTTASSGRRILGIQVYVGAVSLVAISIAACNSNRIGSTGPAATAAPSVAVTITELPGAWGLASYREQTDKERTMAEAKAACNNPYTIGHGTSGGVTMHLADQNEPSEVFLKVSPDGRTYLGPNGPPGIPADRAIVSFEDEVLVTDWVDPSARQRYGTMVFVRCKSPA